MKTQTNKSIKTKKTRLLLSTESVNTLKPANSWPASVVWQYLTKMAKTQTAKSIKTKRVGLILSTELVNELKTANTWLDRRVVW